jgi:hypothetical protein
MTLRAPIIAGIGFLFVFMNVLMACITLVSVMLHPPARGSGFSDIELKNGLALSFLTLICTSLGLSMGLNLLRIGSETDQRALRYRSLGKWYIRLSLTAGVVSMILALIIIVPILLRQGATP